MKGARGLVMGVLGLSIFEAVISTDAAATRAGGIWTSFAAVIQHLMDPAIPLIPDLRTKTPLPSIVASSATSTTTGSLSDALGAGTLSTALVSHPATV